MTAHWPRAGPIALLACVLTLAPGCAGLRAKRVKWVAAPAGASAAPTVEKTDEALALALLRLAVHPSPAAHKDVGAEYLRVNLPDQAFEQFTAAIGQNRRDADAYEARARIWRDWGFAARGLGDAARATYYAPQSAPAHNTWGTLLAATGQLVEARREFDRARALDPGAAYPQTNLCYVEFASGDLQRAIADCRRAVDLDPESVVARNNLALSFAAAGQYAAAEAAFLALGDASTGHYNVGVAYLAAGRFGEARAAFDAVGATHPLKRLARARAAQARALAAAPMAETQSITAER